jgi:hypothetical protein
MVMDRWVKMGRMIISDPIEDMEKICLGYFF